MSVETQYFKIIKEFIEGKDKWVLYHLKNESYKRICQFAQCKNTNAQNDGYRYAVSLFCF